MRKTMDKEREDSHNAVTDGKKAEIGVPEGDTDGLTSRWERRNTALRNCLKTA